MEALSASSDRKILEHFRNSEIIFANQGQKHLDSKKKMEVASNGDILRRGNANYLDWPLLSAWNLKRLGNEISAKSRMLVTVGTGSCWSGFFSMSFCLPT